MVREAEYAESRSDFKHKLSVAQKEINESIYWLELLEETGYLSGKQFQSMNEDAIEIIKLITSIIKSANINLNHKH
jgi:four helix bundle protein